MNPYIPVSAKILDIVKHTDKEWTFRVNCNTKGVLPESFMRYLYLNTVKVQYQYQDMERIILTLQ